MNASHNIHFYFHYAVSMMQPSDNSVTDKPEDTSVADRIQDIQNPLTQST